jgi:hypothetical protein
VSALGGDPDTIARSPTGDSKGRSLPPGKRDRDRERERCLRAERRLRVIVWSEHDWPERPPSIVLCEPPAPYHQ